MEDKDKPVPDIHIAVGPEAVDRVIELSGALITELNLPLDKPSKPVLTMEDFRVKQPEQELPHQNRHTRRQVNAAIKRVQRRHDRKKK